MSDLIEAFQEYLVVIKALASNSIKAYISDLNDYEVYIKTKYKKTLLEVSSDELLEYLATFDNPRSQNRHLSSINSFYNFANEHYDTVIPKGSFAKVAKTLPKYLTQKQIFDNLKLIDRTKYLGQRDYALILFLYATGVRVSELIQIKKTDIEQTWVKVLYAKGSKQRVVPIAPIAKKALEEYISNPKHKSNFLFLNYQGKPLSRISVYKICKQYYGVSPHIFRHSFATSLILGGADLIVVSDLLGHSNLETTQIYTHIEQHHLKDTIDKYHPLNN